MEKEEFLEKALMHEVVRNRIVHKMADLIENVYICNYHLKKQGSDDRMTIEDVLEKFPETSTPGVQLLKASFSMDDMISEAYKVLVKRDSKAVKSFK